LCHTLSAQIEWGTRNKGLKTLSASFQCASGVQIRGLVSATRPRISCKTPLMTVLDHSINTLQGQSASLNDYLGKALLVVNVASKCGLTPQYTGLEQLQKDYAERGFSVIGFPCNQFGAQEPGSPEEIETFCSTTYGVTFPMMEKIDVNGDNRHPIYQDLTEVADADGKSGDISWNFEKFLISPAGQIVGRYGPMTAPDDAKLVADIEANLPG